MSLGVIAVAVQKNGLLPAPFWLSSLAICARVAGIRATLWLELCRCCLRSPRQVFQFRRLLALTVFAGWRTIKTMNPSRISHETLLGKAIRLPFRLVPKGAVVLIVQGPARGKRWVSNSASHGYWLGYREIANQRLFAARLRQGDVVYDIGAHVGLYMLGASAKVGSKVTSMHSNRYEGMCNICADILNLTDCVTAAWSKLPFAIRLAGETLTPVVAIPRSVFQSQVPRHSQRCPLTSFFPTNQTDGPQTS